MHLSEKRRLNNLKYKGSDKGKRDREREKSMELFVKRKSNLVRYSSDVVVSECCDACGKAV